jgi:hypothetical protein
MKSTFLRIVNPILFLLVLVQVITGLGQRYAGQDIFILFRRIHYPNGILLIIFFIVHLFLNWSWIKVSYFRKKQ